MGYGGKSPLGDLGVCELGLRVMSYGGKSPLGDLGVNYHKFTKLKIVVFWVF